MRAGTRAAWSARGAGEEKLPALLAGAGEIVITPDPVGTFLIGPMELSTGVNDDLFARALVLNDGRTQAVIITMDWLGFDFAFNAVLVAAVAEATGTPADHVVINCSHTHSAPLTIPWGTWERAWDKPFHRFLPQRLAQAARKARAALRPVRLRHCRGPAQVGVNRRYPTPAGVTMAPNPLGRIVPWVDVLAAEGADGRTVAVLLSHAAHPVIVHGSSTLISADWPGFAVRAVREARGDGAVVMFAQGCGASINGFPLRGGIDAARAAGRDLAQAAMRAMESGGGWLRPGRLRVASEQVLLPLQAPPPAKAIRQKLAAEADPARAEHLQRLLAIAEGRGSGTMPMPIRAVAVGRELCVLTMAHECVAEYQLYADGASPFPHTMAFAYTNGVECYVATADDYRLGERGGYEAFGSASRYRIASPPAPAAEALVRKATRRLFQALRGG